ncbi:hypothetical protein HY310_00350 [Candidatus Microgenomates bacterium]|nr:hypothetical protein [Candidatus Microgenomates bacterium]
MAMQPSELEKTWKAVLGELEVELGKNNFAVYFRNSKLLSLENNIAKLGFKNAGVAQQTNSRYYAIVQSSLQKISNISPLSLIFEGLPQEKSLIEEEIGPLFVAPKEDKQDLLEAVKRCHLRVDFTFEDFCVSTSNQLAFAAATATAQKNSYDIRPKTSRHL